MKSSLASLWFLIAAVSASSNIRSPSSSSALGNDANDETMMMSSILERLSALEERVQTLEGELAHEREERRKLQDAAPANTGTTTVTPPTIPDVSCDFKKVDVGTKRYCTLDAPLKVNDDFILEGDADFEEDLKVHSSARFNGNVYIDGPSTIDSDDSDEEQETTKVEIEGHVKVIIDSEEKFQVKTDSYFEDDVEIKKDYSSSGSSKKKKKNQPSLTVAGDLDVEYGDVTIEEGDLILEDGNLVVEKGEGYFDDTIVANHGIEISGDLEMVGGSVTFGSSATISSDGIAIDAAGSVVVGASSLTTSALTVDSTTVTVP